MYNYPVDKSYSQYLPLYNAVKSGDLDIAKQYLGEHSEAVTAAIAIEDKTALHVAAIYGRLNIVEELVRRMTVEDVAKKCGHNLTALHEATYAQMIDIARCLVRKNRGLLTISIDDDLGQIPVTQALQVSHKGLARYFYHETQEYQPDVFAPENGNHGATLLNLCCHYSMLDIALELLNRWPRLAVTKDCRNSTLFEVLANIPSAFPSGYLCDLPFWQRWIYNCIDNHQEPASGSINKMIGTCLGIKNIYEAKFAHEQTAKLLKIACEEISTWSEAELERNEINRSLYRATERGIPEFIKEMLKVHIHFLWKYGGPKHIFFLAVECRQANVFSLIHGIPFKYALAIDTDSESNIPLHMAGKLAPSTQLHQISGAALQMQRELQWFKEVESITPTARKDSFNNDPKQQPRHAMTPRQLFTESHKDLVKEGEKWMKETATSCTIVAALIATVVFAAAFTVPGGNDQNTGFPIFSKKRLFMLFIISDAVSLFSSSTAILMFLGILTSRYAEDDFLTSIPTKLIIGLSTLFISIATMMVAFCAALFVIFQGKIWIVIPVGILASVPVTLFVWLQFPLLIEVFRSTYGPSIFDRNVKRWL